MWRQYLAVGTDSIAPGEAGVGGHADVTASEDVAAGQVLAFVKEEVAEGVGEPAINLVGPGVRQHPHDTVNKLIAVSLVFCRSAGVLQEEPLQQGNCADTIKRQSVVPS